MDSNMYVDSDYSNLVKEVNELRYNVAEKIVEKEWLENYIMPEIKYSYILKVGLNEADALKEKIKLEKIKMKISLLKERQYDIDEVEKRIEEAFEKDEKNYKFLRSDIDKAIEYTKQERLEDCVINKMNQLYKELVVYLNPIINIDNGELEDQLYDAIREAYSTGDVKTLLEIKIICMKNSKDANVVIGDYDSLEKIKNIYNQVICENQKRIIEMRSSELYTNKVVIQNESLIRRRKDTLTQRVIDYQNEYNEKVKELEDVQRDLTSNR